MIRKYGSQDMYYSHHGLGSDAAQIIDLKDGKIKIAFWNEASKAKVPKTRTAELDEVFFFSERCPWKMRPPKLVELENDPATIELVGRIDRGLIAKRVAASNLGIPPEYMNWVFKRLVAKFRETQPPIVSAESGINGFLHRLSH